jgi:crotonobetainyl-CoA:carnitine CoA-transferase CaiB-like acyl-CoA transferase
VTTSVPFTHFNRNKRSLAVDMSREEGRDLVRCLIRNTDVVVENFSLSVMRKWGFDYPSLRAIKPDLIMLDMQGLGQTGPRSSYITYGPTLHSYSGLTSVWGFSHPWFVDYVAAEHGVVAILSALWQRARTGDGTHVDLAQVEALASLLGVWYLEAAANGAPAHWSGATDAPQGCFPCRGEDAWCAIAVQGQCDWQAFVRAAGHPEWADTPAFNAGPESRLAHASDLTRLVADWTRQHDARDLERRLQAAGISAMAVRAPGDLLADPHFVERGFFATLEHPIVGAHAYAGLPIHLSDTPGRLWRSAPLLGQDNAYVLRDVLGLAPAEIERLTRQGVLE